MIDHTKRIGRLKCLHKNRSEIQIRLLKGLVPRTYPNPFQSDDVHDQMTKACIEQCSLVASRIARMRDELEKATDDTIDYLARYIAADKVEA
jgi:hypothetical protein